MPEIVLPGLREVGNGATEAQGRMLAEERKAGRLKLWAESGTAQECEESWRKFLLEGTPDWEIWS